MQKRAMNSFKLKNYVVKNSTKSSPKLWSTFVRKIVANAKILQKQPNLVTLAVSFMRMAEKYLPVSL